MAVPVLHLLPLLLGLAAALAKEAGTGRWFAGARDLALLPVALLLLALGVVGLALALRALRRATVARGAALIAFGLLYGGLTAAGAAALAGAEDGPLRPAPSVPIGLHAGLMLLAGFSEAGAALLGASYAASLLLGGWLTLRGGAMDDPGGGR